MEINCYTLIQSFAASGGIWRAYSIRPYNRGLLKTENQKQKRNPDHIEIPETRFFSCLVFFSCLDARKEPKENQGIKDASQVWLGACLEGRILLRPYISWYTDILTISSYPCRAQKHTPPERFRRKRRGVPMHKNDHSPPPAVFVGRILLRPYTIGKSEIKKRERIRYPCRGVLHTPHKYLIKDHFILHKYTSSPSPAVFVGRMQYAPTLPENLKSKNKNESGIRVEAYCIRPTNILLRIIMRYTNTPLYRLRRRSWGVCNTPLP